MMTFEEVTALYDNNEDYKWSSVQRMDKARRIVYDRALKFCVERNRPDELYDYFCEMLNTASNVCAWIDK